MIAVAADVECVAAFAPIEHSVHPLNAPSIVVFLLGLATMRQEGQRRIWVVAAPEIGTCLGSSLS